MKAASIYVSGAIVVGILEIIDGVLLILNHGLINDFNLTVTLVELAWFFVSTPFIFVFHRLKLSMLSPILFVAYIMVGLTIASVSNSSQSADVLAVPVGYAIAGTLFGIFYVIINEKLRCYFGRHEQGSSK